MKKLLFEEAKMRMKQESNGDSFLLALSGFYGLLLISTYVAAGFTETVTFPR